MQLQAQITNTRSAEIDCADLLDPNTPPLLRIRYLDAKLEAIYKKNKDTQMVEKHYESLLKPMRTERTLYTFQVGHIVLPQPVSIQAKPLIHSKWACIEALFFWFQFCYPLSWGIADGSKPLPYFTMLLFLDITRAISSNMDNDCSWKTSQTLLIWKKARLCSYKWWCLMEWNHVTKQERSLKK